MSADRVAERRIDARGRLELRAADEPEVTREAASASRRLAKRMRATT